MNLSRTLRSGIKLLLFTTLLVAFAVAYLLYQQNAMEKFCSAVPADADPQLVTALAKREVFIVLNLLDKGDSLVVSNQASPIYRYACVLKYDGPVIVKKTVSIAD